MFTGIVREIGAIRSVRTAHGVTVLALDAPRTAPGLAVGDSVSVNGVCLTATAVSRAGFRVDLSPETIRATTARRWRAGDRIHLETSLRASDALGGHFVLGHVDDVGRVARVRRLGASRQVTVAAPAAVLALLIPKGSIAVDGVSLTLDTGPFDRSFTVTLIPETLRATRFASLEPGDTVNLEVDVLAKAGRRPAGGVRHAASGRDTHQTAPSDASPAPGATPSRAELTVESVMARGWRR